MRFYTLHAPKLDLWNEQNLAYMAGQVDNASIFLCRTMRKSRSHLKQRYSHEVAMRIISKDLTLMNWMINIFGGTYNAIEGTPGLGRTRKFSHFRWSASGKLCVYIIYHLQSFLKTKKNLATLILAFGSTFQTGKRYKISEEEYNLRNELFDVFKKANAKHKYDFIRDYIQEIKKTKLGLFDFDLGDEFGENISLKTEGFFDHFIDSLQQD